MGNVATKTPGKLTGTGPVETGEVSVTVAGNGVTVGGGVGEREIRVAVGVWLGDGKDCRVGVLGKPVAISKVAASASSAVSLGVGVESMGGVGVNEGSGDVAATPDGPVTGPLIKANTATNPPMKISSANKIKLKRRV